VLGVAFKQGTQTSFPVWENVYLIEAVDDDEAAEKGLNVAKRQEGDAQGTFTWDGRPATWVFKGIRKVISVAGTSADGPPTDGCEVTYSTLEFESADELARYLDDDQAKAVIVE